MRGFRASRLLNAVSNSICYNFSMDATISSDVNVANIEKAAKLIDPVFRDSPQYIDEQLCAALGRRVVIKVETANPIRSFKGRGADFLFGQLDKRRHIVCSSAGNFGQAMAYAGRKRGMKVEVFVSSDVNPVKLTRMKSLGAEVKLVEGDGEVAKQKARSYAEQQAERIFIEDGENAAITEGAGTIGLELLKGDSVDTIVAPVGDGALITGIGLWVKEHSPKTKIVGVCASGSPAMAESWRAGRVIASEKTDTIADGIAVRAPIARSVDRMRNVVDQMVLVDDAQMLQAMRLAAATLGLILEPAGAAGLAAIQSHSIGGDVLATVLTGSNIHPDLLTSIFA